MENFSRKEVRKFLSKITMLLILFMCLPYISTSVNIGKELTNMFVTYAASEEESHSEDETDINEGEYIRLTDTEKLPISKSNVGYYGSVKINQDYNGNKLSVKREGAYYEFDNGLFAHANANIYYDVSRYSEEYHTLTTYIGLNRTSTAGDGVKVFIYTSDLDNPPDTGDRNWTLANTEDADKIIRPGQDAIFESVDITGAKHIRIQVYCIANNTADHAVFIDPMLITDDYIEENNEFLDISEYDERIRAYGNKDLSDPNYELLVLQRKFVSCLGNYALKRFVDEDPENMETLDWLMNDVTNLRYYLLGGTPNGGYYNSLKVLTSLLKEYKNDFDDKEEISDKGKELLEIMNSTYSIYKGDLYKRMVITLCLTHSSKVALWMQPGNPLNQSDAVERYRLYKYMYNAGMFKATDAVDITPWFETYNIEEMRYVMQTLIDDESVIWLNEYTQSKIDKNPSNAWGLLTPHSYIAYVYPNYSDPRFYDENNKEYFNELFSVEKTNEDGTKTKKLLFDYIPYRNEMGANRTYKLWMNFRNKFGTGSVCGGISKSGHCIRGVHGIASAVIGQPGHAALIYYSKNSNGQGAWGIDNDVSGWTKSEKGERLLIGWGNDRSYVKGYNVPYIALAQEALNDYNSFVKAEELLMTLDVYDDKDQIYKDAIAIQPINLDAWAGRVKLYLASDKTEEEYYNLAAQMMDDLKLFPFTMYNLSEIIRPKFTSNVYKFKFAKLQNDMLTSVKNYNGSDVIQPGLTRTLANSLLGTIDTKIADFSFDGADAGKIKLGSRFNGSIVRWDYSLDGKNEWKPVFTGENGTKNEILLSEEELNSVTPDTDIYVHIVGVDYSDENCYKIDILNADNLPANLYANDLENRMIGVDLNTEWRYNEKEKWTKYSEASPNLTGDRTVELRQGASGLKVANTENITQYMFTVDTDTAKRKYVSVSHLTVSEYSTQSVDNKRPFYAPNAIDGNGNTLWHTDFRYNVLNSEIKPFITIKLDEPRYISALEFKQLKYKTNDPDYIKNARVYVREEGTEWQEAGSIEDCPLDTELRDITFAESVYGQYIKIEMDTYNMFASLSMVNVYEDLTKVEGAVPTAGIAYSTTEKTNEPVIARLVNPSTKIKILNNDGKDTYVFTKNGDFTFEFEDERGIKGTAVAIVNWIDKDGPTVDVSYKLSDDKKLIAVLDDISEDVYLVDKANKKTNYIEVEDGKVVSIAYLDDNEEEYKLVEVDENRVTKKITYLNTIKELSNVKYYITALENGKVTERLACDEDGNRVELSDDELAKLEVLEQIRSNPLEFYLERNEEYEFRLLDIANNLTYKNIKADYIENDTKVLVSDISYSTTLLTNDNVTATINTYIIDENGKDVDTRIVNNDGNNEYVFEKNGEFTFEYSEIEDDEDSDEILDKEIKTHTASVNWIDKDKPTAKIKYTQLENEKGVIASLVNESEEIIITNNGGSREYVFNEDGKFTFEFQDRAGNTNAAVAEVDWLDEKPRIKGDTNGDGEVNIDDLAQIKFHLVKIKLLSGIDEIAGDMNDDGEITIDDLAIIKFMLIRK